MTVKFDRQSVIFSTDLNVEGIANQRFSNIIVEFKYRTLLCSSPLCV